MLRRRRRLLCGMVVLALALASSADGSQARESFKVDPVLQLTNPDAAKEFGIHEELTAQAIKAVTPRINSRALNLILAGVVNSDLTHQWDDEFHFDNISSEQGLFLAIAHTQKELADAVKNAREGGSSTMQRALSDEFTQPGAESFEQLYGFVEQTLKELLQDPSCTAAKGCPTAKIQGFLQLFATFAPELVPSAPTRFAEILGAWPNPDTEAPTNRLSLYAAGKPFGRLTAFWKFQSTLLAQIFKALVPAKGGGLQAKPGLDDDNVAALVRERDFYNVYPAFMALGHAFHAAQDFFAHSNYVELMAGPLTNGKHPGGVPVGDSIASYRISPEEIPLPQELSDYNVAGLKRIMGPLLFSNLETGWASTPWLGEKDFCASKYSDLNPIEQGQGATTGLALLTGLPITPGHIATPPEGFSYCHYPTTANPGLNKDEPFEMSRERSHRNYPFAHYAALKVSTLLWKTFVAQFTCAATRTTQSASAASGFPPACRVAKDYWAGTWKTSTGGFALHPLEASDIEIAKNGKDAVQLYNKLGSCPGPNYYRGGYVDPNDRGKIMGCGTSTHIVGRWLSNEDGNAGSFDITITSTKPAKFRGWAQSDGRGRGDWTGTWQSSSGGG